MDHGVLSQFDHQDLINVVIVVLVVLASSIGGFVRWLVRKFREAALEKEQRLPPTMSRATPAVPRARTAGSAQPPAVRPMPPRPVAKPLSSPSPEMTTGSPRPMQTGRRPQGVSARPGRSVPGSVRAPKVPAAPRTLAARPASQPTVVPQRPTPSQEIERGGLEISTLTSSLEGREKLMGQSDPQEDLGLSPKGKGAVGYGTPRSSVPGVIGDIRPHPGVRDSLRRAPHAALRRAVILKEILGPPVSLRGDESYP